MATELAQAYVQIIPSAQGIQGKLAQTLDGEANAAGMSFGGKMVGVMKKVFAAAAIGKVLKDSIVEGAALEQSLGGIETLFKENADKVIANAKEAYRTAGMSANEYMELTTSFSASLLKSVAGDTSKAADIADMAMTDMSDNANKMGSNMEDIKNAYQGFAKQNYTMLDNLKLGYGGTKTEMQRLLADAQKVTGIKYDINNLSDVYEAIHVIQGELDITGTTAKEASTTLAGSFTSLKAVFKDVMGNLALGLDVGPSMKALANSLVTFVAGNLIPAIWNIIKAVPGGVIAFIQALIPQVATAFTGLITTVRTQFPKIISVGAEMIMNLKKGISNNFPQIVQGASNAIAKFVKGIGQSLPSVLQSGIEIIGKMAAGLIRAIPTLIGKIPTIIASVRTAFSDVDWGSIGRNIISGIAKGLRNAGNQLWNAVKDVLGSFKDRVLEFFGIHSPSRWGVYVGEMIDAGLAKGITGNSNMVNAASEELRKMTMSPFSVSDLNYSVSGRIENEKLETISRLDAMVSLMKIIADKDVVLTANDRVIARTLRDMGVVFA